MKKVLSIILTVALLLAMVACFTGCSKKGGNGSSIAGKYVLDSMEADGQTISFKDLQQMAGTDLDFYIEVKDDGTAVLNVMDDITDLKWDNGQMWSEEDDPDEKVPFTVTGNTLTMEQDGVKMVFKK